ncbi:hypothetical protein FRX94_10020 [Corynebacterium canis]|uniref:TrwC relaxase domain-containing protein n=1 Tax=Corynebacterium canis TaxID=679663 RepID=A0A5C5UA87_9CORY|nr:hypothetical protein FRX94_10020 [Corynebacterium canis]
MLSERLGLKFRPTPREDGKAPVWEVVGVPTELLTMFSMRRALARPVYDRMVADFTERYDNAGRNLPQKDVAGSDPRNPRREIARRIACGSPCVVCRESTQARPQPRPPRCRRQRRDPRTRVFHRTQRGAPPSGFRRCHRPHDAG